VFNWRTFPPHKTLNQRDFPVSPSKPSGSTSLLSASTASPRPDWPSLASTPLFFLLSFCLHVMSMLCPIVCYAFTLCRDITFFSWNFFRPLRQQEISADSAGLLFEIEVHLFKTFISNYKCWWWIAFVYIIWRNLKNKILWTFFSYIYSFSRRGCRNKSSCRR
jgi:hypothetical protein